MPYRIYSRAGSPALWLDIKIKGRRRIRRSSGTADRKIAEALAARIEAREWTRLIHGDPAALSFAEATMIYVDDGKPEDFTAKLVAHFRNELVAAIKPGTIRAAARVIYPDASPATWNRQVITPTRAIINHAAGKGLAAWIKVSRFPELRPVRHAPDAEWLPAFTASAPPRIAALAMFMRVTAARVGQAIAIDWSRVDLQAGTAVIPAAKGYPERLARLPAAMVAMLANLDGNRQGRVFGFKQRWQVYRPWKAACTAAGIAYVPTHSAGRRAFATLMQRAGVDPKTAAELGGWRSLRLMLEIYTDADTSPGLIERVFGTNEAQSAPAKAPAKATNPRKIKRLPR